MSGKRGPPRGGKQKQKQNQYQKSNQPQINAEIESNWDQHINDFDEMGLEPDLVHGIFSYGFKVPSEIQSLAIQPIHEGRNLIAHAQSGTGKTGAFGIGILSRINVNEHSTQALVLAPTRELAIQIYDFIKEISNKMKKLTISCFIGGDSSGQNQKEASSLPHIVIASPGRALDLIEKSYLRVDKLSICCFDEADELLDEGFLEQIKSILQYLSPEIQILLFSSTYPAHIYQIE